MKTIAIILMSATALGGAWQKIWKETNSYAAAKHGTAQYATKHYEQAAKSYGDADRLAPSAKSAFNLGTAQIAAGKTTEGSATLDRAMKDPALRADSFFNRGNSALQSKAYEYAIRDYVETLKLRPNDVGAKRNLEIALEQLQQQKKSAVGRQGKQQPSPSNQQQQQKAPSAGNQQEQQQESDAEALLRSVQQQEQEELQRMKRARADNVRVGW